MGKKHDEVVHSLTGERIKVLLEKEVFGEKGIWGTHPKNGQFSLSQLNHIADAVVFDNSKPVNELIEVYKKKQFELSEINKSGKELKITIEIEKPIIKGNGQYKVTKGYLDIFCVLEPSFNELFHSYKDSEKKYIVIEVKKLSDFEDTGSIIRQLNEYKEYFKPFDSYYEDKKILWYIYCDEEIPQISKEMITNAGYKIITENKEEAK